jgi:hypothetical protein
MLYSISSFSSCCFSISSLAKEKYFLFLTGCEQQPQKMLGGCRFNQVQPLCRVPDDA